MFKAILQKIRRNNLGQNKDNVSFFFLVKDDEKNLT